MAATAFSIEDALYQCNKCGFCQSSCPLYQLTRRESAAARGELKLIRAVHEGQAETSEGYVKRLYDCFMCRACAATCPSGAKVEEILLAARESLARANRLPTPSALLSQRIMATGSRSGQAKEKRLDWTRGLEALPPTDEGHELLYFAGCVSALYPEDHSLPQAVARLLQRAGEDYAILGMEERCCGYPFWLNGQREEARAMAEANLERVRCSGARRLLTACPACYRMWRQFYPGLLGEALGIEVLHVTEWLQSTDLPLAPLDKKVTYHDPCMLGRGSGVYDSPRAFLSRIQGLRLLEMPLTKAEALCCGGGGNMEYLNPEASAAAARMRVMQAVGSGAEMLVTACPQCKRMLSGAGDGPERLPVMDITELAWSLVAEADRQAGQR